MRSRILPAALALLSFLSLAPGMSLEEAGKLLSADDFPTREEAEDTLRNGGSKALPILEPLMRSDDPEVRARASKARNWITYGLNEQIPKELREQLLEFSDLPLDQQLTTLRTLAGMKPGQPVALALLHSRIARRPDDAGNQSELNTLSARFIAENLRPAPIPANRFDPLLLHVTTRALILNALASDENNQLLETYSEWLALDETLRAHLDSQGVILELRRLHGTDDLREALAFLSVLKDRDARTRAITDIRNRVQMKPGLPVLELSQAQAAGYLEVMFDIPKLDELYALYLQLQERHNGLPGILIGEVRILEVLRLLERGEFYPAFDLAWASENDQTIKLSGLFEAGQWAAGHPDKLADGLPDVAKDGDYELRPFLTGLAPIEQDTPPVEIEVMARRFSELDLRSPRPGSWLSAAFSIGHIELYVHTMALRERLDEVITSLDRVGIDHRLLQTGKVLGGKPALCEQINFKTHSSTTLRQILTGFLHAEPGLEHLVLAVDLATRWEEAHPDLLEPATSTDLAPLVAYRHWQQGNYRAAAELLAYDENSRHRNVRYLASLLDSVEDLGIAKQLDTKPIHVEFLIGVISAIQEDESSTARQIETALILDKICRTRNGGVSKAFNLYNSRKLACAVWRQGHDDLAYRLMEEAFWSDDDPEEARLGVFPEISLLLGRINEALARAEASPGKNERDALRHAYLLAAADRPHEALVLARNFPNSDLYLHLLSETGDWAALSEMPGKSDTRSLRQAWCAYLADDPEAGRKHLQFHGNPYINPSLRLLLGEYNEVILADFKREHTYRNEQNPARRMARDSFLLAFCEDELMTAIEAGKAVPYQAMRLYFEDPGLLPDPDRTVLLAQRLGELPQSSCDFDPWFRNEDWKAWAHKTLAVSALARLGRRDLALGQLHSMLGEADALPAIPDFHRQILLKALLGEELSNSEALQKLATLEKPEATAAQRLAFLSELAQEPDVEKRITTLLDMAKRHQDSLDDKEVTELITRFARLLGQPAVNAANLKGNKEQWLADFRPLAGPRDNHEVPSISNRPRQWTLVSPSPGKLNDPRADHFSIVDGIARVQDLCKKDREDEARVLMTGITMRTLLDEKFVVQSVDLVLQSVAEGSSHSRSFHPISPVAALVCLKCWDLPAELVLPATRAFLNMPTNHESSELIKWASEIYAKHGEFRRALQTSRTYHRNGVSHTPGALDALDDTSHLLRLEILSALQDGHHEATLAAIRRYLQIDPYQTEPIATVLRALHTAGDQAAARELDEMLTSFWQSKLVRLPNCRAYQAALDDWRALVEDVSAPNR